MFRHGFGEQARAILARAETAADTESVRRQVGLLKLGVVYVACHRDRMGVRRRIGSHPAIGRRCCVRKDPRPLCTFGLCSMLQQVQQFRKFGGNSAMLHKDTEDLGEIPVARFW